MGQIDPSRIERVNTFLDTYNENYQNKSSFHKTICTIFRAIVFYRVSIVCEKFIKGKNQFRAGLTPLLKGGGSGDYFPPPMNKEARRFIPFKTANFLSQMYSTKY